MSGGYDPIVVAWFMDLDRWFATAAVTGRTTEGRIAQLTRGGIGAIRQTLSEKLEIPRLSGADITLLHTDAHANLFEPARLLNMRVQLLVGFAELDYANYLPIFTGVVDRYQIDYTTLRLSLTDSSVAKNVTAAVPVGPPYFVGAPSGSTSKRVPLILGTVTDAPTIELTAEATGTLALDLGATETVCYLREFGAPFPATGRVTIDTEDAVAYAARRVVNLAGSTYLALSGLTRTQQVPHSAGAPVTLQVSTYDYLIGYQIGTLFAVREAGVLVSPTAYQLVTLQADRPVAVLQFATKRGQVTVDVTSESVDTTNHLTNGGFETGDETGWTAAAGGALVVGTGQPVGGEVVTNGGFETGDDTGWTADNGGSLAVGTSAPAPVAGTYRGALTGGVGSYGDIYQDITTVPGNVYAWSLWYQNLYEVFANLLANGGFESGDLTGWTVGAGATPGILVTFETTPTHDPAEGTYNLRVVGDSFAGVATTYGYNIYQDIPTTIGATYRLRYAEYSYFQPATGGGIRSSVNCTVTSDDLTFVYADQQQPSRFAVPSSVTLWNTNAIIFTAQTTTTRIQFRFIGDRGFGLNPFFPSYLDDVYVALISGSDQSQAAYQLGTPSLPALYAHATLPFVTNWTQVSGTFAATDTTTRLRLRSQSASTPLETFFDAVSVVPTVSYDVLPFEGAYRAALTGGLDSAGEAYQDFATTVGEHYTVTMVYRNALDHASNVVVNGSFEPGDAVGWTVPTPANLRVYKPTVTGGSSFVGVDGLFIASSLPATSGVLLTQDVVVTPGSPYTFAFHYSAGTQITGLGTSTSTLKYKVGTPSVDDAYLALTIVPESFQENLVTGTITGTHGLVPWSASFTPTDTVVRFTFVNGGAINLDLVTLTPTTPTSDQAAYQLGTPTVPDFYASAALAQSFTWRQIRAVFKATDTTTRLTLRSQYSGDPQPSYFDALLVTLGGGGLNPTEAIQRVIETYLPTATLDRQSFLEAQVQLGAWEFSGSSLAVTDVETLLQRLAQQCGSLLLKDAEDQYSLVVLNDDRPIVAEFTTANIITPTMSRESSPQDAIYTEFYVYFGVRTGGTGSASDFSSVTYATPFETSATDGATLLTRCRVARAVFGKDARLDVYCEWIQDFATANLLLAWLVNRYTTSPDLLRFTSWLDALPVTVGRMIAVRHPLMQYGGARALAEVIGWQFQPQQMQVELQARLLPYAQNILDLTLEDLTVDIALQTSAVGVWYEDFRAPDGLIGDSGGFALLADGFRLAQDLYALDYTEFHTTVSRRASGTWSTEFAVTDVRAFFGGLVNNALAVVTPDGPEASRLYTESGGTWTPQTTSLNRWTALWTFGSDVLAAGAPAYPYNVLYRIDGSTFSATEVGTFGSSISTGIEFAGQFYFVSVPVDFSGEHGSIYVYDGASTSLIGPTPSSPGGAGGTLVRFQDQWWFSNYDVVADVLYVKVWSSDDLLTWTAEFSFEPDLISAPAYLQPTPTELYMAYYGKIYKLSGGTWSLDHDLAALNADIVQQFAFGYDGTALYALVQMSPFGETFTATWIWRKLLG